MSHLETRRATRVFLCPIAKTNYMLLCVWSIALTKLPSKAEHRRWSRSNIPVMAVLEKLAWASVEVVFAILLVLRLLTLFSFHLFVIIYGSLAYMVVSYAIFPMILATLYCLYLIQLTVHVLGFVFGLIILLGIEAIPQGLAKSPPQSAEKKSDSADSAPRTQNIANEEPEPSTPLGSQEWLEPFRKRYINSRSWNTWCPRRGDVASLCHRTVYAEETHISYLN